MARKKAEGPFEEAPIVNAQLATQMNAEPPVEAVQLPSVPGQPARKSVPARGTGYGAPTHPAFAVPHNGHMEQAKSAYTCADCIHLEARIRKAFKEMGHDF